MSSSLGFAFLNLCALSSKWTLHRSHLASNSLSFIILEGPLSNKIMSVFQSSQLQE